MTTTATVVVCAVGGLLAGIMVGLLVRADWAYRRGVRAGQALEANAHGHVPPPVEPRRIVRQHAQDWQLVDRQMPARSRP